MEKKKRWAVSNKQKECLVEFMENHPELNSHVLPIKQSTKLWEKAARILNAEGPCCSKSWSSWRKSWYDIKEGVRIKLIKQQRQVVGGREPTIILSDLEDRISVLIYKIHDYGHRLASEVSDKNDDSNNSAHETNVNAINDSNNPYTETNVNGMPLSRKRKVSAQPFIRILNTANRIEENIKEKNNIKRKYYAKKLELLERLAKAKEKSYETKIRIAKIKEKGLDVELRIESGIEKIAKSIYNIENVLKINPISLAISE